MFYVYSLVNCPYSEKAELLFKKLNIIHTIIKVDSLKKKEMYKKKNKMNTFPQIFYGKPSSKTSIKIGGYTEFFNTVNISYQICNNKLEPKIIDFICKHLTKK